MSQAENSASPQRALHFLYSTYERYPADRVDLTELFSRLLVDRGHRIVWHMQRGDAGRAGVKRPSDRERVLLGEAVKGRGLVGALVNKLAALRHDLRLTQAVAAAPYRFVQVRDKAFAGLVALRAARRAQLPFFYWMSYPYGESDLLRASDRALVPARTKRAILYLRGCLNEWLLYRVVLPGADHVFVQSEQMKRDLAGRGIEERKMTAVPMGFSLRAQEMLTLPALEEPRLVGRAPLVYVGTLVRERRLDFLFHVLARVRERMPEALLVLVGDAPAADLSYLQQQARRLGVDQHVLFTGWLPMPHAWAYIRAARVCLSPFRPVSVLRSTSPTKLLEYLAWQRPVVASEHPEQTKILEESRAGLSVKHTPEAFAGAVVELLENPVRAAAMGARGLCYVREQRSYEALARKLEARYFEILSGAPHPGAR